MYDQRTGTRVTDLNTINTFFINFWVKLDERQALSRDE